MLTAIRNLRRAVADLLRTIADDLDDRPPPQPLAVGVAARRLEAGQVVYAGDVLTHSGPPGARGFTTTIHRDGR